MHEITVAKPRSNKTIDKAAFLVLRASHCGHPVMINTVLHLPVDANAVEMTISAPDLPLELIMHAITCEQALKALENHEH
jgi:hypothetical protein